MNSAQNNEMTANKNCNQCECSRICKPAAVIMMVVLVMIVLVEKIWRKSDKKKAQG